VTHKTYCTLRIYGIDHVQSLGVEANKRPNTVGRRIELKDVSLLNFNLHTCSLSFSCAHVVSQFTVVIKQ